MKLYIWKLYQDNTLYGLAMVRGKTADEARERIVRKSLRAVDRHASESDLYTLCREYRRYRIEGYFEPLPEYSWWQAYHPKLLPLWWSLDKEPLKNPRRFVYLTEHVD